MRRAQRERFPALSLAGILSGYATILGTRGSARRRNYGSRNGPRPATDLIPDILSPAAGISIATRQVETGET